VGFLIYWRRYVWNINTHLSVCFWRNSPQLTRTSFFRFLDHTQRLTTVSRTPLDEWSARRRALYLTTQHSKQTDNHAPSGIRIHNLSKRAAADARLRQRGHWDRHYYTFKYKIFDRPIYKKLFLASLLTYGSIYVNVYCGPRPNADGDPLWRVVLQKAGNSRILSTYTLVLAAECIDSTYMWFILLW